MGGVFKLKQTQQCLQVFLLSMLEIFRDVRTGGENTKSYRCATCGLNTTLSTTAFPHEPDIWTQVELKTE